MTANDLGSLKEKLVQALAKVDRPGSYCTAGEVSFVLPGLHVDGVGTVALPLNDVQAERVKERCEQAAYGKGEQTLVDTNVRRVWRLKPDRFQLSNPQWRKVIGEIVGKVQTAFGLEDQTLEAHLYDLLLYEPGSFFLPHRDGEKLDRMVATLVVVLPSAHTGGELVVRHEGTEQIVDFSGPEREFALHYAAFYADCEHEVRPLTSGHRLCLVYNLTLGKAKGRGKDLQAPSRKEHVERIAKLLAELREQTLEQGPSKFAFTLEHQYTQEGIAWDALKGADRAQADLLLAAAKQAGYCAYLALVTLWESGSTDDFGDGYYSRGRRQWGDSIRRSSQGKRQMLEVYETTLEVNQWRSPSGEQVDLGPMPIKKQELVQPESLKSVTPEEEFEGYTGNEGMTLQHWYRHAAMVLWPAEKNISVLCSVGSVRATGGLKEMLSTLRDPQGKIDEAQRNYCLKFAGEIISQWPQHRSELSSYSFDPEESKPVELYPLLKELGDPTLLHAYLRTAVARDIRLNPFPPVTTLLKDEGWQGVAPELKALVATTEDASLLRNAQLFEQLAETAAKETDNADRKLTAAVLDDLSELLIDALIRADTKSTVPEWQRPRLDRQAISICLVRGLLLAKLDGPLGRLLSHLGEHLKSYPLLELQIESVLSLAPWLAERPALRPQPLRDWITACRQHLASLTAAEPAPPQDFRRIPAAKFNCKCADCKDLQTFLASPTERERSFPMVQQRRNHLADQIRSMKCDLVCATNTRPRPQVLICTKNTATFERDLKAYHLNLELMAKIDSISLTEQASSKHKPQPSAAKKPAAPKKTKEKRNP